jgi:hypothetical protein
MCLHLWNFWQIHRWTRLEVLPENETLTWPKIHLYVPSCAPCASGHLKQPPTSSLFRSHANLVKDHLLVEVNFFGALKTEISLESSSLISLVSIL